jgi:hypothetical protein
MLLFFNFIYYFICYFILFILMICSLPQLFGELQRGKSVMSVSGVLVKPEEVMDAPPTPGGTLLLLDCPTVAHWEAAAAHPAILELIREAKTQQQQQQQQEQEQENGAAGVANGSSSNGAAAGGEGGGAGWSSAPRNAFVVVHLGARHVISSSSYQEWLRGQLGAAWEHVIAAADDSGVGVITRRAAEQQAKLSSVDPVVFSVKGFQEIQQQQQQQQQMDGKGLGGVQQQESEEGQQEGNAAKDQQQQSGDQMAAEKGVKHVAKHMSKLVLTPLKYRGWDDGEVQGEVDLVQVAAEAVQCGGGAVQSALEEFRGKREEVEKQGVPEQLKGLDR